MNIKPDTYTAPTLVKTEKLNPPLEELSLDGLIEHLIFIPTADLPTENEIQKIVADKLNGLGFSKVLHGGKAKICIENKASELTFHDYTEYAKHHADKVLPYKITKSDGFGRKSANIYDLFKYARESSKYDEVVFNPSVVGDFAQSKNLFTGFSFKHKKFEPLLLDEMFFSYEEFEKQVRDENPHAERFFHHLYYNVCDSEDGLFLQVVAWFAQLIQHPEIRSMLALVIYSPDKGSGKSILFDSIIRKVLGKYMFSAHEKDKVFGRFNGHLMNKLLIQCEEMSWGGDRVLSNKLKDMITANTIAIEQKNLNVIEADKYFRMVLVTNEEWAVSASNDERRFIVCNVNPQKKQNTEYFSPFVKNADNMAKAVFNVFSNCDYSEVDLTKGYESKGLVEQKVNSLMPIQEWWLSVIEDGVLPSVRTKGGQGNKHLSGDLEKGVSKIHLHEAYLQYLDDTRHNNSERLTNPRLFGKELAKLAGIHNKTECKISINLFGEDKKRVNGFSFSKASVLMKYFKDKHM